MHNQKIMLIFVKTNKHLEIMIVIGCVIGLVLGIGLCGIIATRNKLKCNHKWSLIESGNVRRHNKLIGIYRFYECEHCLKFRKEQVEVD